MVTTNRLFQDFISFATDVDPGASGTSLSAPGLTDLLVVASPDFVALTLDPEEVFGAPEIVWVSAHSSAATTATIVRGQEGTSGIAHAVGTKGVISLTQAGIVEFLPHRHGSINAERTTNQVITDDTETTIVFDSIVAEDDPSNDLSYATGTGIMTINTTGWYIITAYMQMSGLNTDVTLRLVQNGVADDIANSNAPDSFQGPVATTLSYLGKFTATDTLRMRVFFDSGGPSGSVRGSGDEAQFSVARIS